MNIDFCPPEADRHLGENATHPIEPHFAGWAALLLVAGIELVGSSHLAQSTLHSALGRVQLRFLR